MKPTLSLRRSHLSVRCAGLVAAVALAWGGVTPDAAAQDALRGFSQSLGSGDGKVDLLADKAIYDLDGHWATFVGNVVIRVQGQELRAERIRFNTETYQAQAVGRVILVSPDGSVWSGDSLDVNLRDKSGSAGDVAVYYKPFRIDAAKGQVVQDVYVAEDVVMTTCTNAPGDFHYCVTASTLRLRPGEDLTAHHTVGYLFGVPYFYFPYYWKDLKRHYGLRFEPGYRSPWGAYLLTTYKARVYRDEDNRWIDSRTSLDVRSKRGLAYGQRFNWYLQEQGDGWFSAYFIDDKKDPLPRGVEDPERYRIRLNHGFELSPQDRVLVQGVYVSDDQVMREFFEREYADMWQPDNFVSYTHTARDAAFGVIGRIRLNEFYDQVERLPEAWLSINQRELGSSGVYYDSHSAASFLRRLHDERNDPMPEDYEAARFDTWHRLNMPLKVSFLNVIPRVSYRGTYYSESQRTWETDDTTTTVETNALGQVTTSVNTATTTHREDAGATFRNVIEFGAEASFKAYGMWTGDDGTLWRHVVEPYSNYTFIPEPNVVPEELYQFDDIDAIDFTHLVRLGVRNRWQYKKGDSAHEVAMVDVYGDVLLEPEENQDTLDRLYLDSEFRPTQWMRWDVDAEYSLTDAELSSSSTRLQLWHDRFSTTLEYRYQAEREGLAMGALTWTVVPGWDVNVFGRYEFESSLVEEVGGYLQRSFDCVAFRVYGSVVPGYTRSDSSVEEDDYRVSFVAWLTHFPPDSILESNSR